MPPKKKLKGDSKQLSLTKFMKKDDNNNEVEISRSTEILSKTNDIVTEENNETVGTGSNSSEISINDLNENHPKEDTKNDSCSKGSAPCEKITEVVLNRWKKLWPWLSYVGGKMYCIECKGKGKDNTMTSGCTNFKTSSWKRHEETSDHIEAIDSLGLKSNFEKAVKVLYTDEDQAVMKAISTVIWLAKENLPLSKYESLRGLLTDLKVPGMTALHCSDRIKYESYYAATELLESVTQYIDDQLNLKLSNSPCISVLADESTDIANKKRITLNAIIVDPVNSTRETVFLNNLEYEDGSGIGLATVILDECKSRNIPMEKVIGFGSDGAAVMTGADRGVKGILMRKQPFLIHIHCMAHRLALCTSQAAENVHSIKLYQRWLTNLFYYFKASGTREQELHKVQELLNHKMLKYKEIHAVRWLSCYQAVEAVYRTLDPLMSYFHQREASKDAKAKGLLKSMATTEFIFITYLLMDVLPLVSKLCLKFQQEDLDLCQAKVAINTCVAELEAFRDGKQMFKTHTEHYCQDVVEKDGKYEFSGHILVNKNSNFNSIKSNFINNLLSNIRKRFPQKDLLDAFYVLGLRTVNFEPEETFGNTELEELLKHFGEEKTFKDVTVPPLISKENVKREWMLTKNIVKSLKYPVEKFQDLWTLLTKHHGPELQNIIQLAQYAIVLPLHTADCERVFSQQNKIITKQRAKLSASYLNMLLKVRLHRGDIPTDKVLALWRKKKNRILYSKREEK